ncbi:hypothetical protein ABPG72_008046 [Tetrahymena utriculariae]
MFSIIYDNQFQQGTTTISYRIEDIRQYCKNYKVQGNVNLSQVKKIISQQMLVPMKELKIQKIMKHSQQNEEDDLDYFVSQQMQYKDNLKIENLSTLIFGIDSFQKQQLNFQFKQYYQTKNFCFNVYQDDTLYNLRAKLFIEIKLALKEGDKLEFQSPEEIQMEITIDKNNQQIVTEEDLELTVQQFIEQKFQKVNLGQEFILDYQKSKHNQIQLMISDQILETQMQLLSFEKCKNHEDQINTIIQNTQMYFQEKSQQKFENFYQSFQSLNKDKLFQQLYENKNLIISVGSDAVDIRKYLEINQQLKDGDHLNFTLSGSY